MHRWLSSPAHFAGRIETNGISNKQLFWCAPVNGYVRFSLGANEKKD